MRKINNLALIAALGGVLFVTSCKKDEVAPEEENVVEIFTDVKLVFTNTADASDKVEARAQDPDGTGVEELTILDDITLDTSKTYTLTYEIFNNLNTPGENIGAEILEEDNEHQFFFTFSNNAFANPVGNGNIDNAADPINYNDTDENNHPVGLSTQWTTPSTQLTGGTFTVRLQHQPDVKTGTSGSSDGDTDFDLTFVLNIQ
ncbi:MAG: GTP cyclohydrolase [Crocinitomicaceae bacterium]|nr:GTP cyclohydrolase [Crocinitomicaceae bacterium]